MVSINEMLIQRKSELQDMLNQVEDMLKDAPEGRLRISHVNKTSTYFLCGTGTSSGQKSNGFYLRRGQETLIRKLAQKGYAQHIKQEIKKQLQFLEKHVPDLSNAPLINYFTNLPEARRKWIVPIVEDDYSYAAHWQAAEYTKRTFSPDAPEHITERGDRVLSKSEKILADKFFRMNIPYHYEKPLNLPGFGWIRPDFTLLNVRTREEFYWEHLGMLDNSSYAEENVRRLNAYIKAGIYPGKQLILTWETKNNPLDWRVVEALIAEYLV